MKSICLALALIGCGSTANDYNGQPNPNKLPPAIQDASADIQAGDVQSADLAPCVSGTWWLHFLPNECPLCDCLHVPFPPGQLVRIGNTIQVFNCTVELASVLNDHRCVYRASPKCVLMSENQTLIWDGKITFERFDGRLGDELLWGIEVGIGAVIPGGTRCPMTMALTKEDS